jgi:hypothetical protein
MAFLHQTKFRPACVVSALPKRFRDSLSRELKDAFALSTCPVSELESTVRRQGATIAVVGVSEGTIEVAERLSHTDRKLRVFLAHYEEGSPARLNGFAGVFDLRAEAKRLAAAIKGTVANVELSAFQNPSFGWSTPNVLGGFIDLQKKVGNPAALSDSILDHLMDLAGATEGFLLQPERMDETTFRVAANRGKNMPPIGQSIELDPCRLSSPGSSLDIFEAQYGEPSEFALIGRDHFALPIKSRGQLCAILICDKIHRSESFDQFLEAMSYLFNQVAEREKELLRQQLIATARSSVIDQAGWLLVDGDGHVIHHEGLGSSFFKLKSNRVNQPRVRDLVYRSFHGEVSPIEIGGRRISARTVISDQGLYCLLEIHVAVEGDNENSNPAKKTFEALAMIRSSCAKNRDEKVLSDGLLAGLVEGKGVNAAAVQASLETLGVKVDLGTEEIQPELISGLGLVLFMASKELRAPLSGTLRLAHGRWILTAEIPEQKIGAEPFNWNGADLFRAALTVAGLDYQALLPAVFGFQLMGNAC